MREKHISEKHPCFYRYMRSAQGECKTPWRIAGQSIVGMLFVQLAYGYPLHDNSRSGNPQQTTIAGVKLNLRSTCLGKNYKPLLCLPKKQCTVNQKGIMQTPTPSPRNPASMYTDIKKHDERYINLCPTLFLLYISISIINSGVLLKLGTLCTSTLLPPATFRRRALRVLPTDDSVMHSSSTSLSS
jgi:hypothetical protein